MIMLLKENNKLNRDTMEIRVGQVGKNKWMNEQEKNDKKVR